MSVWKDSTIRKAESLAAELRFQRAMLSDHQDYELTKWLARANILATRFAEDLKALDRKEVE